MERQIAGIEGEIGYFRYRLQNGLLGDNGFLQAAGFAGERVFAASFAKAFEQYLVGSIQKHHGAWGAEVLTVGDDFLKTAQIAIYIARIYAYGEFVVLFGRGLVDQGGQ